jgi:hypothetical protein
MRVLRRYRPPVQELPKGRAALSTKINEESSSRYCLGGYHAVRIGDSFKDGTYTIVNKLGFGLYSTVWLAHERRYKIETPRLLTVLSTSNLIF